MLITSTSMKRSIALLLSAASFACSEPTSTRQARAYQIEDLSQAIGGPKAIAQPGDYIIENDRVRIAILGNHISMGPHTSGASIVDADIQRHDPRFGQGQGNDQLAGIPTANINVQQAHGDGIGTIAILNDGSDGGAWSSAPRALKHLYFIDGCTVGI